MQQRRNFEGFCSLSQPSHVTWAGERSEFRAWPRLTHALEPHLLLPGSSRLLTSHTYCSTRLSTARNHRWWKHSILAPYRKCQGGKSLRSQLHWRQLRPWRFEDGTARCHRSAALEQLKCNLLDPGLLKGRPLAPTWRCRQVYPTSSHRHSRRVRPASTGHMRRHLQLDLSP